MINEAELIERLEKCKAEGNTGAFGWNDAMNLAISMVKDAQKQESHTKEDHNMQLYELPVEPIDCAAMLINATIECENSPVLKAIEGREKYIAAYYTPKELRQIAEHLLVYCNHAEDDES